MAKLIAKRLLVLPLLATLGCVEPPQFLPSYQPGGPQGILGGTLTYSGPLPCTEKGQIVGGALLLAFDTALLPPPEGLGTTAASLGNITGDTLFGGVKDQLTYNPNGDLWCPNAGSAVTVSGDWIVGPLPGGEYEIRAFYDYGGLFDPAFSISKLPRRGDVAGGAIDDVPGLLMQAAAIEAMSRTPLIGTNLHPEYRRITLGAKPTAGPCVMDQDCSSFGDGNTCQGGYCMPPQGANIEGIAVTLGLPLPLDLPVFNPTKVLGSSTACVNNTVMTVPTPSTDPSTLTLPSDYQLPVFSVADPMGTEKSILRVQLTAGVAPSEVSAAEESPLNIFRASDLPLTFTYSYQDVNGDGVFNINDDHSAASTSVPAFFPLVIFSKLANPSDHLTAQSAPVVILQGLTIFKDLTTTAEIALGTSSYDINKLPPQPDVFAGITPAVVCLDPADTSATATATLLVSNLHDCSGNPLLTDQVGTVAALKKQFNRPITVVQGCLPPGAYAMNLVYGTGQAWSVPNEAGVCAASEQPQSADGTMCNGAVTSKGPTPRPRLPSQDLTLTIGAPSSVSYCVANPTPAACCPATTDGSTPIDPATGTCKCPNTGSAKWPCP
jgi:hypothetical protein